MFGIAGLLPLFRKIIPRRSRRWRDLTKYYKSKKVKQQETNWKNLHRSSTFFIPLSNTVHLLQPSPNLNILQERCDRRCVFLGQRGGADHALGFEAAHFAGF